MFIRICFFKTIIYILIIFTLLGLTRLAFAVSSCSYSGYTWTFASVNSYNCADDMSVAVAASDKSITFDYGGSPLSDNPVINDCLGVPDGSIVVLKYNAPYVNYDVYYLPPNASGVCAGDSCSDLESRLESECGGPGTYEINTTLCIGHCNPSGQCAQAYEDACLRCGSCDQIAYFDNVTCTGVCEDCKDEYEQKKLECPNPWPVLDEGSIIPVNPLEVCEYTCSCSDIIPEANAACPFGFQLSEGYPCSYTCLSCSQLEATCKANCPNGGQFLCEDVNNIPKDHLCICKESNCDAFYDSCHAACDTPECGGVKVAKCLSSGDEVTYTRCECNGCAKPPENPDGGDGGDDPSDDPADGSDLVGWLKAIKENTDTLVVQGDDHTGWLSSIKKNGDTANQILEKIAGKNTSVTVNVDAPVVNVDTQSVVNAIGQANQKLDGIGGTLSDVKGGVDGVNGKLDDANGNLEGIGGTLTDIKDILSGEGGEVEVIAGTYSDMPETGYGEAPTDDDLPTAEETNSAFGTLTTREDGYRGQLASKLSTTVISVSSTSCQSQISIPWFVRSGWTSWSYSPRTFILDFCPYQSYFEMLGFVLVFVVSLYELYRFS